jgi:hypothetical protein
VLLPAVPRASWEPWSASTDRPFRLCSRTPSRALLGPCSAPSSRLPYLGAVAALAAFGLFGIPHPVRAAILLPGVAIGLAVAPLLARHIDGKRLRLIILGIGALSGLTLLVR